MKKQIWIAVAAVMVLGTGILLGPPNQHGIDRLKKLKE
jgi:hypothetical protein